MVPMVERFLIPFVTTVSYPLEVRGNAWVIAKKISTATDGHWVESCELHMMTSATLIEALYEAVDEYLHERGKKTINEFTEQAG